MSIKNNALTPAKCPMCKNEIKGFKDPRSLKEYKVSGICQDCQDATFGPAEDYNQVCEECGKEIPKGEEIYMSNYAVCSGLCAKRLVGID